MKGTLCSVDALFGISSQGVLVEQPKEIEPDLFRKLRSQIKSLVIGATESSVAVAPLALPIHSNGYYVMFLYKGRLILGMLLLLFLLKISNALSEDFEKFQPIFDAPEECRAGLSSNGHFEGAAIIWGLKNFNNEYQVTVRFIERIENNLRGFIGARLRIQLSYSLPKSSSVHEFIWVSISRCGAIEIERVVKNG